MYVSKFDENARAVTKTHFSVVVAPISLVTMSNKKNNNNQVAFKQNFKNNKRKFEKPTKSTASATHSNELKNNNKATNSFGKTSEEKTNKRIVFNDDGDADEVSTATIGNSSKKQGKLSNAASLNGVSKFKDKPNVKSGGMPKPNKHIVFDKEHNDDDDDEDDDIVDDDSSEDETQKTRKTSASKKKNSREKLQEMGTRWYEEVNIAQIKISNR